jgi:hypothetical protein
MRCFIFAIGGTGSRVMRSLTFLMAMDQKINTEIVPLLIDMDITNGDTVKAVRLLEQYRNIQRHAYTEVPDQGFFVNEIGTLKNVSDKGNPLGIGDSFQLGFGNVQDTFAQYFKVNRLDLTNQTFLQSLFDDRDGNGSELNLKLNEGFKGNPNIGSLVFNDLIETPEYQAFENLFSDGDKIIVISSIFGGTGSSGFPQLVKNLRNSNNNYIQNARIGAVVVQPYFSVTPGDEINSNLFNSKTKAALSYYASVLNRQVNDWYYLADTPGVPYDNNPGGSLQSNAAHVIELLAAKAIVHFVNGVVLEKANGNYLEYGVKPRRPDTPRDLSLDDFYENPIWRSFTSFFLFCKFLKEGLNEREKEDFYKELALKDSLKEDAFFKELISFSDNALRWLEEMSKNDRAFSPFNLSTAESTIPFSRFIKGRTLNALDKTFYRDRITNLINKELLELQEIVNPREKFIRSTYHCFSSKRVH